MRVVPIMGYHCSDSLLIFCKFSIYSPRKLPYLFFKLSCTKSSFKTFKQVVVINTLCHLREVYGCVRSDKVTGHYELFEQNMKITKIYRVKKKCIKYIYFEVNL